MQLSGDRPLASGDSMRLSGDSLLPLYIQCGNRGFIPINRGLDARKWRVGGKVRKVGGERSRVGGKVQKVSGKRPQIGGNTNSPATNFR